MSDIAAISGATLHDLEKAMLQLKQEDQHLAHFFLDGLYIRSLFIPKGSLVVGKRHRKESINVVLNGKVSIYTDVDGKPVRQNEAPDIKKIIGPDIFVTKPNSKKMIYAHEDTLFCNVHQTASTNLIEIEKEVIIPEQEYLDYMAASAISYDKEAKQCHG